MIHQVHLGDCLEVMKGWPATFVDTIITDPPYGLGFMGRSWDRGVPGIPFWEEMLRICRPGAMLLAFGGTRTYHRQVCAIEDAGWYIRDCLMWLYGSGFPKSLDISKAIDKANGAERTEGGRKWSGGQRSGGIIQDSESEVTGTRTIYDEPATPIAKQWKGYGTALKPAWEPIILAMKPLDGTFAENAEKWGVAGLNVEGGRIASSENCARQRSMVGDTSAPFGKGVAMGGNGSVLGRWPANLLLDEEAAAMLDRQVGMAASRFFYCAKASLSEREEGLDDLKPQTTSDGRKIPADNAYQRGKTKRRNTHPTVKPLKLMEYLCKLTKTPTGGIVLDPFAGSGSTLLAAHNVGRPFIGIEQNQDYRAIALARLGLAA